MAKREPQQNENPKTTLFVTGQRTSQILKLAVADLSTLKRPFCERFTKKNDIHPFDDASCTSIATSNAIPARKS
jgi:ribosome production factor 2